MSSAPPSPAEIARDATWLVQALDPRAGLARLVRMDAAAYRTASFLDDRVLQQPHEARLIPMPDLARAVNMIKRPDARWIFHIGHVGSTLIARLLGELAAVLAVREPRSLRDLVGAPRLAPAIARLMSRGFTSQQLALVKATSFVSEIAPALIGASGRALFLIASPRNYIGTILAGENSVRELHALAPSRAQRLAPRWPSAPQPRSLGDLAAIAWACEASALEAAAAALPQAAIAWTDFDRWLAETDCAPVAAALGLPASATELTVLKTSPLLERYSKALDHEYSAALRAELIAESSAHYARDIDQALAMLERGGESAPMVARALRRAEEG